MDAIFLTILNSSISAVWVVLAVLLARLLLKKAPKWLSCVLWGLVALRLLCPISIESMFSLVPDARPIPQDSVVSTAPVVDATPVVPDTPISSVPVQPDSLTPAVGESADPAQVLLLVAAVLWVAGMLAMVIYTVITTLRLRRQVAEHVPLEDRVYLCDGLTSPFILGVLRPRIYLPVHLNEEQRAYVLAHERAHLRRCDHLWKPLGYLLLMVHWFNPILWVAYILLCRDIESACDQRVVRDMDAAARRRYSETLLACSMPRRAVTACPIAFGETGVKSRIKSVLHYKKPAFWLIIVAALACVVVAVCFVTDPPTPKVDDALDTLIVETVKSQHGGDKTEGVPFAAYTAFATEEDGDRVTVYGVALYQEYRQNADNTVAECGSGYHDAFALTAKKTGDTYTLVEYWTPKDGSEYEPSIREKFPRRHVAKALNGQRYAQKHRTACRQQAEEYFGTVDKSVLVPYACDVNGTTFALDCFGGDTCHFSCSPLSSYRVEGVYTLSNGILTMDFTEFKLVFQEQGEVYVFDANVSDPIPDSVKFGANYDLPHGTVFFRDVNKEIATRETFSRINWVSDDLRAQLYAAVPQVGGKENLPAFCFRTRGEWESFMQTYWGDALADGTEWATKMQARLDAYDDAFFAENALLVAYYQDGSCSVSPYIADVQYSEKGPTMSLLVDVYEPDGQDDGLGEWFITLGLPQSAVASVKEVQASVRDRIEQALPSDSTTTAETTTTTAPTVTTTMMTAPATTTTKKPSLIWSTTATTTTRGTVRPTNPPRKPNANGVINIVDWDDVYEGGIYPTVLDVFYEDENYEYYFGHPKSVTVYFADGSSKSIRTALKNGEITVKDLEEFGIKFGKAPKRLMFYERENNVKGEPELFYSDGVYDYYFERPISDYVVAHEGHSLILLKDALERGVLASIDDFISVKHDIPYFVVKKAGATVPSPVLGTITAPERELPDFQPGRIEFCLTEQATKEFTVKDGTAAKKLSERLGIDILEITETGKTKIDEAGTRERRWFQIRLDTKDRNITQKTVERLKKHKDIYSANAMAATMYVGEIYVTLTAEATWQYTKADYDPKVLSEKLGFSVTGVLGASLQEEISAKDGKPTGRYRQVILITTSYDTEFSTEAIAKRIGWHKDVYDSIPNWV